MTLIRGWLIGRRAAGISGVYFGPVTTGDAHAAATDGRIAGDEFLSFAVSAGGAPNRVITLMVQVPTNFDWTTLVF